MFGRGDENLKIAIYGLGSFPIVCSHLIKELRKQAHDFSWCSILPSPHYRHLLLELMPDNEILDLFSELPRHPVGGDDSELVNYHGSLIEDIAANKTVWDSRSGEWRYKRGFDYYRLYKKFLTEKKVTHLFIATVENEGGKIISAIAKNSALR